MDALRNNYEIAASNSKELAGGMAQEESAEGTRGGCQCIKI